jgi:L,D-transpeptidase-like protein
LSSGLKYLQSAVIGLGALVFTGAHFAPRHGGRASDARPVGFFATAVTGADSATRSTAATEISVATHRAIAALTDAVHPLSSPLALEDAFRSYFAFRTAHPSDVRKPYLYFVDYGLPSTTPRGYVFDMRSLKILDGPFTVAHGRGSSPSRYGVPTRFSNDEGSEASSLGLYLAADEYRFLGRSAGRLYHSIGLRLVGVSGDFNDNALSRRVVAHGAPYVTPTKAGRSEGCPAMELARAKRLLPKLADGGMVFLFAPDSNWLANDPWLTDLGGE